MLANEAKFVRPSLSVGGTGLTSVYDAKSIQIKNIGKGILNTIQMSGYLGGFNGLRRLGSSASGGFLISLAEPKQCVLVDEKGRLVKVIPCYNTSSELRSSAWNSYNNRILQAYSNNTIYQLDQNGTYVSGANITPPSTPSAITVADYPWNNPFIGVGSVYVACDSNRTVYNMSANGGSAVAFSFAYPAGLSECRGIAYDGYTLLMANNLNTIYRVNALTGALIETITLPVNCDGGVAFDFIANQLFVGDAQKRTTFQIALGGGVIDVEAKHVSYFDASDLFVKKQVGIFSDAQEPVVIHNNGVFQLWYSNHGGSTADAQNIAYATSTDGINFSDYQIVLGDGNGGHNGNARGFQVILVDSTYHMFYCTGQQGSQLCHSTSPDGVSWSNKTVVTDSSAVDVAWGSSTGSLGNVGIYHDGTQWVMWLESQTTSGSWAMGRLTSPDLYLWTIDPVFPRISAFNQHSSIGGTVPWKKGSKHYMLVHESVNRVLPSIPYILYSNNGLDWAKAQASQLLKWTDAFEVDQMADPYWVEVNGKIYLYYAANGNDPYQFRIAVAVADITIDELLNFLDI